MPSNNTKHNKKALVTAMEKSLGIVSTACKIAKVSRKTFYDYYNNDEEFRAEVDDASNIALDFAESKLHKKIEDGNIAAIIFYLKTKGKKRGYVERQEMDINANGIKVVVKSKYKNEKK